MNRIMRVSMSFLAVLLVFTFYTPLAVSVENGNPAVPKISPIEPHYDFGQAPEGKNVEHIFKIRNTGGSDLVIHQAKGS